MEWKNPVTMNVKINANTNASGYLAQTGETAQGTKSLSINGIKHDASFDQAMTVVNKIYGDIGGLTLDPKSAARNISTGVSE